MQSKTHSDALITKNYILANQKINVEDRNFWLKTEMKKNFFKIGI